MSLGKKIAVAALGVGAILLARGASGYAASPFFVVNAALAAGTTMQFAGTIDAAPITVTCTAFSTGGNPAGASPVLTIAPPTISGCTDSLGGTDTITTNTVNGNWKLKAVGANEVKLVIPKIGLKFKSSVLSGCKVIAAPAAAASVFNAGNYNGAGTLTDTSDPMPVAGSGCTTGANWDVTASVSMNTGAVPPW
jgi:hypothetical protein